MLFCFLRPVYNLFRTCCGADACQNKLGLPSNTNHYTRGEGGQGTGNCAGTDRKLRHEQCNSEPRENNLGGKLDTGRGRH